MHKHQQGKASSAGHGDAHWHIFGIVFSLEHFELKAHRGQSQIF